MFLPLTLNGRALSPEGFFFPSIGSESLLFLPGLVTIEQGKKRNTLNVLVMNHSETEVQVKKNLEVGTVYQLNDHDVENTELLQLSKHSLIEPCLRKSVPKKQPPRTKSVNAKTGANYLCALAGPWLEKMIEDEDLFQKPKRKRRKLHDHQNGKSDRSTRHPDPDLDCDSSVIQLLTHIATQNKSAAHKKDPPDKFKEAYEKFGLDNAELNDRQKIQLAEMLVSFQDLWDDEKREGPITRTTATSHPIEAEGPPLRAKPRRTTPVEDCIIWKHIDKMVKRKVIRKSNSPWAAPILLADKKNGNVRFCVDFRHLNEKTKKDSYPLPRMDEILAALGSSSYFSSIDLSEAFWSIPIREGDIEKAAFTSKYGLWEFLSMPFGLCNAPATQQRFIETVLSGLVWQCCFAYIDDILCYSSTFEQHLADLTKIFQRLRDNDLMLQPAKCSFCKPNFEILGFIATKDGLKPNPKKVEAIQNYPLPTTPKEVERFLGMVTWLKRFIPRSSSLTTHLRKAKVMDPKKFSLSQESIKEIHLLKELLTSETCMAHPDFSKEFFYPC